MSDAVLDALAKGKARLKRGWCKGHLAEDARGLLTFSESDAIAWCAVGAIREDMLSIGQYNDVRRYMGTVAEALGYHGDLRVAAFNDDPATELRHVLGLYDWAAELRRLDLAKERP